MWGLTRMGASLNPDIDSSWIQVIRGGFLLQYFVETLQCNVSTKGFPRQPLARKQTYKRQNQPHSINPIYYYARDVKKNSTFVVKTGNQ